MHGFWWPGRQLVVVLPLALLVVLVWLGRCGLVLRMVALPLGMAGVAKLRRAAGRRLRAADHLGERFPEVQGAPYVLLRPLLTDYRAEFLAGHFVWIAVLSLLPVLGWFGAHRKQWQPSHSSAWC